MNESLLHAPSRTLWLWTHCKQPHAQIPNHTEEPISVGSNYLRRYVAEPIKEDGEVPQHKLKWNKSGSGCPHALFRNFM